MADAGILVPLRISGPEAKFLEYLADPGRGGEISWNWDNCRPDVTRMIRAMIDDKRLLVYLEAERRLRLTDVGRSALAQIQESLRRAARIPNA